MEVCNHFIVALFITECSFLTLFLLLHSTSAMSLLYECINTVLAGESVNSTLMCEPRCFAFPGIGFPLSSFILIKLVGFQGP